MGRKSSLTNAQWDIIQKRLLAGEKAAKLADEFGVNRSQITRKFSQQIATIKTVANQVFRAEMEFSALPVAQQIATVDLLNELRSMSIHAASAGKLGLMTAHRLQGIAHEQVQKIDDADPLTSTEHIKAVMMLAQTANESSKIGMNLIAANKDAVSKPQEKEVMTLEDYYGE